jgi:rhamnosyltransferase
MISVVIPVKNGGSDLVRCLEAIVAQQIGDDVEVVVVDSGSSDGSAETAHRLGARVHSIAPTEFHHGRTRNLGAELARGDILVFTSQDAHAADEHWLVNLTSPLAGEKVAGAYGRQLPHRDARPPERYFLDFLYGPQARTQRLAGADDLSFEMTLFSNVNSAIPRRVWERHRFADDIIMSEDQEWSRRVLRAGMTIHYEPSAAVHHSHTYTVADAFRRFFDSGASAERSYVDQGRESKSALWKAGARYARGEIAWLWRTGERRWIPYATLYELAKFVGLQLGRRHRHVPSALKRRLSDYPGYWST